MAENVLKYNGRNFGYRSLYMETVISLQKQWWLKVNKKAIRFGAMDGAVFPYISKIQYSVNGKSYLKRKLD